MSAMSETNIILSEYKTGIISPNMATTLLKTMGWNQLDINNFFIEATLGEFI